MDSLNMSNLNISSWKSDFCRSCSISPPLQPADPTFFIEDYEHMGDIHSGYKQDIWDNLLEEDAKVPKLRLSSPQLKFRGYIVHRLRKIAKRCDFSIATLYNAVIMLDSFMNAHRPSPENLMKIALACLSLAAKSEEQHYKVPPLKDFAKISHVELDAKTFKQLEWVVGENIRWRLISPTPVTYAALLSKYVIIENEKGVRPHEWKHRPLAVGQLEAYLDLTLSNVRLTSTPNVIVACACLACARADLGYPPWPVWLAARTGVPHADIEPTARILQRMMQILKDQEIDQGYSSARTSPALSPCTSPNYDDSTDSSTSRIDSAVATTVPSKTQQNCRLSTAVDMRLKSVQSSSDHRYCRSIRLRETSSKNHPSTSVAVKRGLDTVGDIERKRCRLSTQMSQVVL